ncbi:MAG: carboxypeptidase-like regulatory domain-containing protein, partial [Planctomycetota bacterium]|nr:carboxypeptidase-like regulatory domain-containing protein [Planctomycetota bacterium]
LDGGKQDFVLDWGKPIAGTVVDDKNKPVARADLTFSVPNSRITVAQCHTDGAGRFQFDHLPDVSLLNVSVRHIERRIRYNQQVKPGETDLQISNRPPIRVRGRVLASKDDTPVTKFSVRYAVAYGRTHDGRESWSTYYWHGPKKAFSSPAGEFDHRFGDFGKYKYVLCIDAPGFASTVFKQELSPGNDLAKLDIRLERGFILSGNAVHEAGRGIANARIVLRRQETIEGIQPSAFPPLEAVTNQAGKFRINTLSPGKYEVTGTADGFASLPMQVVEISGDEKNELSLTFTPGATLKGTFRINGKAASNARLILVPTPHRQGHRNASLATGSDGSFSFKEVSPGTYLLWQSAYQWFSQSFSPFREN